MHQLTLSILLSGIVGATSASQAAGQPMCKPVLAISGVQFSKWQPPSMERKWTAVVSIDASRCASNSEAAFAIGFSRLKENGVEIDFRQRFLSLTPAVNVSVDFWADEAVERYWIDEVAPCPCRD